MAKNELVDLWALETEKVNTNLGDYSFTITGNGGVGKSSFANELFSRFGKTAILACEDRFKGIRNARLMVVNDWATLIKYRNMIRKGLKDGKGLPFNFLTIDPVGKLGDFCEAYIKDENGVDNMGDVPYGGAYAQFENEFTSMIRDLRNFGIKVNFVSHGKSETITPPRQEGYDVQMPDIQKKLKYLVKDEVDFLLYLTVVRGADKDGNPISVRRLYMQNYPEFSLKVPLIGFPDYIEWAGSTEEGVEQFIEAFNKAVVLTQEYADKGEFVVTTPSNTIVEQDNFQEELEEESAEEEVVDDTSSFDEDDEDGEDTLNGLRDKAIAVRDTLLEEHSKQYVIEILKKSLGTAKISECNDPDKLVMFIRDNQ